MKYRIGKFYIFDSLAHEISSEKGLIKLPEKYIQVLELLLEHHGEVVEREQIFNTVWKDTIVVEESLTQAISELRKCFSDSPQKANYIQTVPKKGYRFLAPVEEIETKKTVFPKIKQKPQLIYSLAASIPLLLLLFFFLEPKKDLIKIERGPYPATSFEGNESNEILLSDADKMIFTSAHNKELQDAVYLKSFKNESYQVLIDRSVKKVKLSSDEVELYFLDGRSIKSKNIVGTRESLLFKSPKEIVDYAFSSDAKDLFFISQTNSSEYELRKKVDEENSLRIRSFFSEGKIEIEYEKESSRFVLLRSENSMSWIYFFQSENAIDSLPLPLEGISSFASFDKQNLLLAAKNRIYKYNMEEEELTELFFIRHMISSISYSVRTKLLAFSNEEKHLSIWEKQAAKDHTDKKRISSNMWDYNPIYGERTKQLAFISTRCGNENIWLSYNDTTAPRPLTKFLSGHIKSIAWTEDEKGIYFSRSEKGILSFFMLNVESGRFQESPKREITQKKNQASPFYVKESERNSDIYLLKLSKP